MVSAGESKLRKTFIHFVTSGTKINSACYCNDIWLQLLSEVEQLSNSDYLIKQDGARSHKKLYSLTLRSIPVNF